MKRKERKMKLAYRLNEHAIVFRPGLMTERQRREIFEVVRAPSVERLSRLFEHIRSDVSVVMWVTPEQKMGVMYTANKKRLREAEDFARQQTQGWFS